jgi:hypothetical protein
MKHTPSPIFLAFMLLVIAGMLSVCEACEDVDDLTEISWKTHKPVPGMGWDRRKK